MIIWINTETCMSDSTNTFLQVSSTIFTNAAVTGQQKPELCCMDIICFSSSVEQYNQYENSVCTVHFQTHCTMVSALNISKNRVWARRNWGMSIYMDGKPGHSPAYVCEMPQQHYLYVECSPQYDHRYSRLKSHTLECDGHKSEADH